MTLPLLPQTRYWKDQAKALEIVKGFQERLATIKVLGRLWLVDKCQTGCRIRSTIFYCPGGAKYATGNQNLGTNQG